MLAFFPPFIPCNNLGSVCYWQLKVVARDITKHPLNYRGWSSPNCQPDGVENPGANRHTSLMKSWFQSQLSFHLSRWDLRLSGLSSSLRNKETDLIVLKFPFTSIVCKCVSITQSCPTLCNPLDCSPPGSSVHGVLQARILAWVAIPFSRGSSQPED